MKAMELKNKWVLVTGASSGLGHEMARQLARDYGAHLVLAARRLDKLEELAKELRAHGVQVKCVPVDLSKEADAEKLFAAATEVPIYAAVLNAGVTHFGHHDELSWEGFRDMISLNVIATTRLATLLLPYLEQRKEEGGLMFVSSMAGLSPVPYQTAYSATKAYLVHLGAALHHEMAPRGVSITTFAPGGIETPMVAGERFNALRGWLLPVDQVARSGIKALKHRGFIEVPGLMYSVGSYLQRLLPQKFFMSQVAARFRKSLALHAGK